MSKLPRPVLSSLRAFEAAARHRSILKACNELHVTRQAVSGHIHKLEQGLGRRLFERLSRRIVLTGDGELLFGAVTTGFSEIRRALAQLSETEGPHQLVLAVDPDFAALWLVPRLAEFYSIVPGTVVEIVAKRDLTAADDPRIDCAIQYTEADRGLPNGETLFRSRLFPVCAPGPTTGPPLRSPQDLCCHVLLHDRSIVEWREYLRICSMKRGIDPRLGVIFSDTAHCMEAAARGQGIAIGDDFLAHMHLSEGRLVRPFHADFPSRNAYYLVIPPRAAQHPAVHMFRSWLLQSVDRLRKNPSIPHRVGG